jgi:hypothetical protein
MNTRDLRNSIYRVLEYAPQGLHIDAITMAIVNDSRTLFQARGCAELLRRRVTSILVYDAKRKDSAITRVINGNTHKPRRGMYKLRKKNIV